MAVLENANRLLANKRWLRKVILSILNTPIFHWIFVPLATIAGTSLRQEANKCDSITDYVNLAFNFVSKRNFLSTHLLRIVPFQIKQEIAELLKVLAKSRPAFVLEIGTARGGTLFLLTRVSNPDATLISLDLPRGEFGGAWYPDWKIPLYRSFAIHRQKIYLIRKDSHAAPTFDLIENIMNGRQLDFLFIDGDHSYEGVKLDFQTFSPLVRKGGLVAFHDICDGPPEIVGGVPRFWNEMKHTYNYHEIIGSVGQKGYGIGVLHI